MMKKLNSKIYIIMCVIVLQIIFVTFSVMQQLKPRDSIHFINDGFSLHRTGHEPETGFYVDSSYSGEERRLLSNPFILDRGVYNVTVDYQTNNVKGTGIVGCWSQIISPDSPLGYLESGKSRLLQNIPRMNYHVYVHADDILAQVENGIDDHHEVYLLLEGITVSYCNVQSSLHDGILLLILFAFIDCALYLIVFQRENTKQFLKNHAFALIVIFTALIVADMPLFQEGIGDGLDLRFHQHRIYQIAKSIESGYFPIYVMPDWMNGYGYASGIFYGDTFLHIPWQAFPLLLHTNSS